jgi:hypothetical protein
MFKETKTNVPPDVAKYLREFISQISLLEGLLPENAKSESVKSKIVAVALNL